MAESAGELLLTTVFYGLTIVLAALTVAGVIILWVMVCDVFLGKKEG